MKILQAIAGAPYGGAENFFVRLAIALERAGVEQKVCIRANPKRKQDLIDGGVDLIELPYGGRFDFMTKRNLKKVIKKFQPDVVLTWMNRATRLGFKVKKDKFIHIGRLGGYYDLKYYKYCDRLIGNTQRIVDYLTGEGWENNKVDYLPNFAKAKNSPPLQRDAYFTPSKAPLIVAMGRFHENKGFDVLLRSLIFVPGAYLWLAGEGPLRVELEALAEKIGVKPRLRFVGWHEDISALLRSADLFVCPSRHEPLGNVIIEAWAHKIPVIASDSDGPGALIDHLVSGVLVPVDNDEILGKAIRNLMVDQRLRDRIVQNGYQRYEESFTEEIVTQKYINFFKKAIRQCVESQES